MDAKDLIETLTTICIFAISIAIGRFNEARKKRKQSSASASVNAPRHPAVREISMDSLSADTAKNEKRNTSSGRSEKSRTRRYSFTAQEEGGSVLAADVRSPETADTARRETVGDSLPNEMLRTMIIGEILANPKFRQ